MTTLITICHITIIINNKNLKALVLIQHYKQIPRPSISSEIYAVIKAASIALLRAAAAAALPYD